MLIAFASCIYHEEFPRFYLPVMRVTVEYFAVLGQDGRKADAPSFRKGEAFHLAHYVLLHDAYPYGITRYGVHLLTQDTGPVEQFYLFRLLYQSHIYQRFH